MEGTRHGGVIARVLLAALGALALAAMAHPVLADGEPTPLPQAISGPSVDTLGTAAQSFGLKCEVFAAPPAGDKWSCSREASPGVYYITDFAATTPLVLQAYLSGDLPWPDDHDQFLLAMVAPFCLPESHDLIAKFIPTTRSSPDGLYFEDAACLVWSDYTTDAVPFHHIIAWAKVDPAALATLAPTVPPTPMLTLPPSPSPPPTASPSPSPTAEPSPTPKPDKTRKPKKTPKPPVEQAQGEGRNDGNSDGPGVFVTSVPTPTALSIDPLVLAQSFGLALLVVLLMPFPAQLFNSTYETHYRDVRRFFRLDTLGRAMGPLSGFWDSLIGIVLFVLLSGVVYALLDPHLSLSGAGLATILGLALGILLTGLLASAPPLIKSVRTHEPFKMRVLPATLLIGLGCVVISRLTGFLPGYVYGVILGVVFARELSRVEQGRANALAAAGMLAVALVSWLLLGFIAGANLGLPGVVVSTLLATLLVACLEGVVFGLLPFRFLPGEPLYATNKLIWGALLLVGAFCFFHILINPASGYLSSTARTPLFTMIALFVGFAALSIAFWAYFRNKPVNT